MIIDICNVIDEINKYTWFTIYIFDVYLTKIQLKNKKNEILHRFIEWSKFSNDSVVAKLHNFLNMDIRVNVKTDSRSWSIGLSEYITTKVISSKTKKLQLFE